MSRHHQPRAGSALASSLLLAAALLLTSWAAAPASAEEFSGCLPSIGLSLRRLSSFKSGNWTGTTSMEVMDYDPFSKLSAVVEARAASVLALLVVNHADPANPSIHLRINVSSSAGEGDTVGVPNSVAVYNGYAALSLDGVPSTAPGILRIYNLASGVKVGETVLPGCAMPDSVAWTRDGGRLVVACEGEPATQEVRGSDPNVDPNPVGAIAIVTATRTGSFTPVGSFPTYFYSLSSKLLSFQTYIDSLSGKAYSTLLDKGLKIDPRLSKSTAGRDIEPEYVAIPSDRKNLNAYVTLQENNAVAVIDLTAGRERIKSIWPLGWKNWSRHAIDPSDRDGTRLRTVPGLYSWLQPDTIVHEAIGARSYLFIANEGDSKSESLSVKDLTAAALDPEVFPNATALVADAELGRLAIDPLSGLKKGYDRSKTFDKQGPYDKLFAYGGRSWAILDAGNGRVVYESGDELEQLTANHPVASRCFNCDRDRNLPDTRSDNAGPEPEALEVFKLGSRTYAAIGLERMGGFVLYDVSTPANPILGGYVYNRNFDPALGSNAAALGDLAPEGIKFVAAGDSNSGKPLLLLSNEVSSTVSAWEISNC
ncbi:hypothetical protein CHLRE_08g359300v5 [Chlamydomonas reinhardtii]|uniref:Choice-of-anchor I domain-containing protein n=1 Tax=Chlamydomonas reinhardtii TaxID=3055 RepID=A8JGF3_CHLRE|nr:uncharacterized protein CHLRE_08g359300v5 [Chlamydomonas reinhardtii]PNW79594.1 hypothetical protein CHLRE_08g359300v5 [Chlamydomonas reinhardtii]|eukprot:XP_001702318.1 alkaline phosphatase [Chlamydomonas reinhardtii]